MTTLKELLSCYLEALVLLLGHLLLLEAGLQEMIDWWFHVSKGCVGKADIHACIFHQCHYSQV